MTYRELQAALKTFKAEGKLDKSFKLNQKKAALELAYNSLTKAKNDQNAEAKFNQSYREVTKAIENLDKVATVTIANEYDDFELNFAKVKEYVKELSATHYNGKKITIVPVTHLKSFGTQWMNTNHVTEALLYA